MQIVQFKTLVDFISELRYESANIADKIVRWEWLKSPEQPEAISFQVDVWATALRKGGDEDYLMEFGWQAGIDSSEDQDNQLRGTEVAMNTHQKLAEACDDMGLKLRPGKIEVF